MAGDAADDSEGEADKSAAFGALEVVFPVVAREPLPNLVFEARDKFGGLQSRAPNNVAKEMEHVDYANDWRGADVEAVVRRPVAQDMAAGLDHGAESQRDEGPPGSLPSDLVERGGIY